MFKFERNQRVFDIAGLKVGGQPGEYPTVMIGSIFYEGHKIVKDAVDGKFDKPRAKALIERQQELSDKTGNPCILDVVGSTRQALIRYVDFVTEATESPFLVDGSTAEVRISTIKHVHDAGLQGRAIYNSIDYTVKDEEVVAIKESGVNAAVILAFNPRNVWPEGRLEILQGYGERPGLLDIARKANVENILIDTTVLDVPSIGLAARAIYLVKSELGLPAGCSPANAITKWKK